VNGVVKEQTQGVAQGRVALQVPPQVNALDSLRNCRAETVPAQRTAATNAEKNMVLVLLVIIGSFYLINTLFQNSESCVIARRRRGLVPAQALFQL
jgi:hypothetical protein